MEFIATFWWIWLLGVGLSALIAFAGFFKTDGKTAFFMIPAILCWVLFLISIVLNIIDYAADKFA